MYKKLFAVLFAISLLFAISGTSMACEGPECWTTESNIGSETIYNNFDEKAAGAYAGGDYGNGYGNFGGEALVNAFADGFKDKTVVETTLVEEWCREGSGHLTFQTDTWSSTDVSHYADDVSAEADALVIGSATGGKIVWGGPFHKFGMSWSQTNVFAEGWGYGNPGFEGIANTDAMVNGYGVQFNDLQFEIGWPGNGAFVSGGNNTGGSFYGEMYGNEYAGVAGGVDAYGDTFGYANRSFGHVDAGMTTYGNSSAWQNGIGVVSVGGIGSVYHQTQRAGSNFSAGTSGSAGFTYNSDGTNYASGSGIASTYGTVNVGSNGFTAHSHSYANSGFGGCGQ